MPLLPEEPQIHESAQGPRATPASSRTAPTPRPVPGPRPARPGRPGPVRPSAPAQRTPREQQTAPSGAAAGATPQIQLIPASVEGALDAAEEAVDLLLDSGRAPGEILVITTGDPHPWAAHELSFGETAYWAQHDAGDDVFHAQSTTAARATTRSVVVVALNGGTDEAAASTLPLALGKAGSLLIVCGDPQRINSILGAGV
ncbi:hypothetical protein HUT18_27675 [Streptomyces sp. NA04227]|uniref:hypothetical protein n=1 Tax=Streptomyces sp. NA04227 TaxID=2742136 RepID=UPI00159287F4|nr:hypothetical protein [Streptomyces sp. NA04227]QKW09616.1 hypothetical protein HUT18_27675 [Streptomyces sp. NA04227]